MIPDTMFLTPSRRKPRNLADGLVASFTDSIEKGVLKPGDKLPTETAIMELHGVSRTVVREAMSKLQAAGWVETRHGIGTFVIERAPQGLAFPPDQIRTVRDVLDILELRISLETEAAWLAATRRSADQVAELRSVLEEMQSATTRNSRSVELDKRFHYLIAAATGNPYFVDILGQLGQAIIPRARLNTAQLSQDDPVRYLERVQREHAAIFQAILAQDADAARAAMRTHLSNSRERLRQAQDRLEASLQ
ncbi:FadR/GntR family transcriptional regulator [Massilia sp. TS11]|uniref:FadR/GntR family transcriptional regulator n=1 Tax=Massilia sp. TS11 TaxID=2908003 RepID=UPI001EDA2603|nr:FadR/GntR family transcriptional regulator [Massilia sp. TS11]MCG2583771.1 FadR family transcriptional regulator [Massilia sp. TS11]